MVDHVIPSHRPRRGQPDGRAQPRGGLAGRQRRRRFAECADPGQCVRLNGARYPL